MFEETGPIDTTETELLAFGTVTNTALPLTTVTAVADRIESVQVAVNTDIPLEVLHTAP